jgi:hypothetical protein
LTVYNNRTISFIDKRGDFISIDMLSISSDTSIASKYNAPISTGNKLIWQNITTDVDVEVTAYPYGVALTRVLKSNKANTTATFNITKSGDKTKVSYKASDSYPRAEYPQVIATMAGNVLTETVDLSKLSNVTYPIRIDPTVDIAASGNSPATLTWNGAAWSYTNTNYWQIGYYASTYAKMGAGAYFANVTVPPNSTINNAHITMKSLDNRSANTCYAYIIGNDEDDAANFGTIADYKARRGTDVGGADDTKRTTAEVDWTLSGWTAGTTYDTPDIKTVIAEITTRAGWHSGHAMAIFIDDHDARSTTATTANRAGTATGSDYSLYIDYTPPTPSVTTLAASSVEEATATLSGNITSLNSGGNADFRGFEWGTTSNVTVPVYTQSPRTTPYSVNWTESGSFSVGSFTNAITGLSGGTTYYYRAYAHNTNGWAYGDESSFLTKPAAPTNVSATDGTDTTKVVVTWTKSTGATGYHIYRDGVEIASSPVGDVATVDDAAADAGTISGSAGCTASDGTSPLHIVLNVAGAAANHGTTHTYTMKAHNATGDSALGASTDTGYRDVGVLAYEWFRSNADADAAYATIAGEGGTTNPYNDTVPAAGVGRWYYCHMTATGATNVDTNHDRGYRSSLIITTMAASGTGRDWAIVNGIITDDSSGTVTSITFTYGTTIAMTQSVTITGHWHTGNTFSTTIRGLSPASVYYFSCGTPTLNFATLGSPNIWEYLNTGCDTDSHNIFGSNASYQTFTTGTTAHTSIYVRLYLKRTGSPSTVTVSLRNANTGSTEPTGLDLATATLNGNAMSTAYTWYQFVFTPQEALEPSKQYSILVQAISGDNANYINWCTDGGGGIAGGIYGNSVNGGVTYSANTSDAMFEVWGYASLQVTDAKVFTNYITTGDWLVTAVVDLTYAPYYNLQTDPASNFQFQLVGSAGNVIAATPIKYWNRQPIGLYIQPAQTTALTWGGTYYARIRLVTGTDYQEYPIASVDWKGSDMKWLDQWVITSAKSLAAYNTSLEPIDVVTNLPRVTYIYTASEILKGTVLNNDGGIIFARGIPSIVERRPEIFQYANKLLAIAQSTYAQAGAVTNWQTQVGTELTSIFSNGATLLGQTDGGKSFGSGLFIGGYVLIAGLVSIMGFPLIGFGLGSGILYMAWQWGLMDAGLFFVSCLLFAFFLYWGLFGGKQG